MHKIYILLILIFITTGLKAQENFIEKPNISNDSIQKLLIGKWNYIKTVDENNKDVKYLLKIRFDDPTKTNSERPDFPTVILNKDFTYSRKFDDMILDDGVWKLISKSQFQYKWTVLKDSKLGKIMYKTRENFETKFIRDKKGNYVCTWETNIISLTENEMKIEMENEKEYIGKYILIYQKK